MPPLHYATASPRQKRPAATRTLHSVTACSISETGRTHSASTASDADLAPLTENSGFECFVSFLRQHTKHAGPEHCGGRLRNLLRTARPKENSALVPQTAAAMQPDSALSVRFSPLHFRGHARPLRLARATAAFASFRSAA